MSLLKKIDNFINFSAKQRNFGVDWNAFNSINPELSNTAPKAEPKPVVKDKTSADMENVIKAKQEAIAKRNAGIEEPVKEAPVTEEKAESPLDTLHKSAISHVSAPKIEGKLKTGLDSQEEELAELQRQVAEKEAEIKQVKTDRENAEALAELKELDDDEELAQAEAPEVADETPADSSKYANEAGASQAELAQDRGKASAGDVEPEPEPTSTPGTGSEAAVLAEAAALAKKGEEEISTPDYNGAKVADASGKSHTIVKRGDGYYIKGTNSKVLDAEGKPTAKYRTLGNALINGQSVNEYVKSKGGWAKYNRELKARRS